MTPSVNLNPFLNHMGVTGGFATCRSYLVRLHSTRQINKLTHNDPFDVPDPPFNIQQFVSVIIVLIHVIKV